MDRAVSPSVLPLPGIIRPSPQHLRPRPPRQACLAALRRLGSPAAKADTSSVKWFEGIGEYVIDWGPGYRLYLARDGDELIILYGDGTKRRQRADIARARALQEMTHATNP